MKSRVSNLNKYIAGVCLLSVVSQIPFIYQNRILSMIPNIAWVFLTFFLIIKRGNKITLNAVLILPIIFDIYCIVAQFILGNDYISSNLFKPINMCTFLFLVGSLISDYFDHKSLVIFSKYYIIGAVITGLFVYVQRFLGKSITSGGYGGKNSLATIILIALILLVMLWKELIDNRIKKVMGILCLVFFVYFLLILKSRTNLINLFIFIIYYIFSSNTNSNNKVILVTILVIAYIYIIKNEQIYDIIVNKILLNGKDANNLNDITSNRMDHLDVFLNLFPNHELFGIGGHYLESFPLTVLLSYGILGSIWVFAFALLPIYYAIKGIYYKNKDKLFSIVLLLISASLIINGIAEEQPPFGPGIKCFVMWFLFGIYYNQKSKKYRR